MRRILSKFLIVSLLLSMVSSGLTVFAEAEGEMAERANEWRTASDSNTISPDLEDDDIYDEDRMGGIHDEIATYTNATPSIPVHDHIYDQKTFYSPQCLEAVTNTFQCRYCEDSYERVIGAAGHVKAEFPFGEQDGCTWDAAFIEMCTRCGEVTNDWITKPKVHGKESELVALGSPQCGPYRYDTYRCGTCGKTGQVRRYTEENQECDYKAVPEREMPSTCVSRGYKEFACKTAKHPETNKYEVLDYLEHKVVGGVCTGCSQTQAQLDADFTYTVRFVSTTDCGNTGSIYKEIQLGKDEEFTVPGDVIEGVHCGILTVMDGVGSKLVSGEVYKNLTNEDGGMVTIIPLGSKIYKAPALYAKMVWSSEGYMDHKSISLGTEPVELTDEAILALVGKEIKDKNDDKAQSLLETWEMYVDRGSMGEPTGSDSSYKPFNSQYVLSDNQMEVDVRLKASGTTGLPAPKTKIKLVAQYPGGETEGIVMKSYQDKVVSSVDMLHNILNNQQKELSKYEVTGYEILKFDGTPYGSGRSVLDYPIRIEELFNESMVKLIYGYRDGSVQVDTNHGEFKTYDQEYYKVELPAGPIDSASLSAINMKIADIIRKGYTFDGIMLDTQEPWEPGYEQYDGRWYKPLNRDTLADTFVVSGDSYLIPKWKPVKINLTIDWNHAEVTADNLHWELDYGSYVPKFYPAVLDGYKIAGYFSEKDGTGEALGTKVLFEDSVFYAQWVKDDVELPPTEDPDPEPEKPDPEPERPDPSPEKPDGGGSGGGSGGGPGGGPGGGDSDHGPGVITPEVPQETLPAPTPDLIPTEKPPIITDSTGSETPRRLTDEELSWYIANNEVPLGYMRSEDGTLVWMGAGSLPKTMDAGRGQLQNLILLLLGFAVVLIASGKKQGIPKDGE